MSTGYSWEDIRQVRATQYSHSATGQECFEMTCRGRRVLWRPFTFSGCSYIQWLN